MKSNNLEKSLFKILNFRGSEGLSKKQIAEYFPPGKKAYKKVGQVIQKLVGQGKIRIKDGKYYSVPRIDGKSVDFSPKSNNPKDKPIRQERSGKRSYSSQSRGSGGTVEGIVKKADDSGCIIIDQKTNDSIKVYPETYPTAIVGDTVEVKIIRRGKFNSVGKIIQIKKRETTRFFFQKVAGEVAPRQYFPLKITINNLSSLKENQWYLGEFLNNISTRSLKAKMVEEIKEQMDFDITELLERYKIRCEFPQQVLDDSKNEPKELLARVDKLDTTTFTIDGEDAKDFDDAISIAKEGRSFRLHVHIADVSHYVRSGSSIDKEALKRGTSIYFPKRVIPMLPENLSNELCSLKPNVNRNAFTCEMIISHRGVVEKAWLYPSKIKSDRRFTYNEVQAILDGELEDPLVEDLKVCHELFLILESRKDQLGAIDFDLPEAQLHIDDDGNLNDISLIERKTSHKIIEEMMIISNETVAKFCVLANIPVLYRNHPVPSEDKAANLIKAFEAAGVEIGDLDLKEPKTYQTLLRNTPDELKPMFQPMALRSMQQAFYTNDDSSHFGLARSYYCHFTSPIRRYPDLIVHRQLKQFFLDSKCEFPLQIARFPKSKSKNFVIPEFKGINGVGKLNSQSERKAIEIEREYVKRKKAQFMSDKVGTTYETVVNGFHSNGVFLEIPRLKVEGYLPFDELPGIWTYDQNTQTAHNRSYGDLKSLKFGDEMKVILDRVDTVRNTIDFKLPDSNIRKKCNN
ncbi:MAG: VacB/RNase II family 3'-5' exoribonuclease [Candidatus Cloacimonetes bacterium]|nr:VacB/RNase II family 3'-5' exoribonuclease [Candidatus Cloacimonadota bacterium]